MDWNLHSQSDRNLNQAGNNPGRDGMAGNARAGFYVQPTNSGFNSIPQNYQYPPNQPHPLSSNLNQAPYPNPNPYPNPQQFQPNPFNPVNQKIQIPPPSVTNYNNPGASNPSNFNNPVIPPPLIPSRSGQANYMQGVPVQPNPIPAPQYPNPQIKIPTSSSSSSIPNPNPNPNSNPNPNLNITPNQGNPQLIPNPKPQESKGLIKVPERQYGTPAPQSEQKTPVVVQDSTPKPGNNANNIPKPAVKEEKKTGNNANQNKPKKNKANKGNGGNKALDSSFNSKAPSKVSKDEVKESQKFIIEGYFNQLRDEVKMKTEKKVKMAMEEGKQELIQLDNIEKFFMEQVNLTGVGLRQEDLAAMAGFDARSEESDRFSCKSSKDVKPPPPKPEPPKKVQMNQSNDNLLLLTSHKDKIYISEDLSTIKTVTPPSVPKGSSRLFIPPNIILFFNCITSEVTSFDIFTLNHTLKARSTLNRRFCTFGIINSYPALIGGIDNNSKTLNNVEILKNFSEFEFISPINNPRSHGQYLVHKRKTYLFMGNPLTINKTIEKFENGVWITLSFTLTFPTQFAVTVSFYNQIVFFGGENREKNQKTNNIFSFDPESNKLLYSGYAASTILAGECMNSVINDGVLYVLDYENKSICTHKLNAA